MTKVENRFLERAMELTRAARQSPDDAVTQLALARHFDGYAFAGILDDKRENDNRENAAKAYRRYLALRPGDPGVRMELARLLVRKGDYSEAAEILVTCMDGGGISTQSAAWYMECLFHLRRFEDLRAFSRMHGASLIARSETSAELADAFRLWSEPCAGASDALPVNAL
jgi:Tfp pilus assembly protein PilF